MKAEQGVGGVGAEVRFSTTKLFDGVYPVSLCVYEQKLNAR